jgi:hypothetical protein
MSSQPIQIHLNKCRQCGGDGVRIHTPGDKLEPFKMPAEHYIVCKTCKLSSKTHKSAFAALKDWNSLAPTLETMNDKPGY